MKEQIRMKFSKRTMTLIALLFVALFSILVLSRIVAAPDFCASTIQSLNDKEATVMKLVALTAASSTTLSLIPGDAAMPIANQIAELTSYFIFILGAILLEKMLVTVVGYVSITFVIPVACLFEIMHLYVKKDILRNLAIKLMVFGIILSVAIPVSIKVSDFIYDSYQTSNKQAIETQILNNENIDKQEKDYTAEDKNWVEKVKQSIHDITTKMGNDISAIVNKGEDTLTTFLDAIAVLVITTCVIPMLVILIFAWLIKGLFGFDSNKVSTFFRKSE